MSLFVRLRRLLAGGLRRQLIIGVAGVHAVMMTVFVYDLVARQKTFLLQRQADQVSVLAENLALAASGWVLARDYAGMAELIAAQQRNPEVLYSMLVDERGVVLAHNEAKRIGARLTDQASTTMLAAKGFTWLAKSAELTDAAAPILANGHIIGWARIGLSQRQTLHRLDKATHDGLVYTLVAILIGSLLASMLANRLTTKLYALRRVSEAVRRGQAETRVPDLGRDEAGQLGRDFNTMLDALAQRTEELASARDALARSEERFDLAMRGANDGLWDWDLVTDKAHYAPRWKAIIGHGEDDISDSPAEWSSRVHPDDLDWILADVEKQRGPAGGDLFEQIYRLRHRDGHYLWVLTRGVVVRDGFGNSVRMVGTIMDISARKALEEALYEEKELAQVTLAAIGDGVITTDAQGLVTFLNQGAERLTGWEMDKALGRSIEDVMVLVNDADGELVVNPVSRCRREGVIVSKGAHKVLVTPDGRRLSVEDTASPIFDREGVLRGVVLVFHDVSETRALMEEMSWQATHDALTGLVNRREFEIRLQRLLADPHGQRSHALLYLDLDQFKLINDTAGHLAGDDLLIELAGRLTSQARVTDTLARLGGDEFGVLLADCPPEKAQEVAEKLIQVVRNVHFTWQDRVFQVGASVGMVHFHGGEDSLAEILSAADMACYAAKDGGRNRVHVHDLADRELVSRHQEMLAASGVRAIVQDNRLVLFAQEIRSLEGGAAHFEILLRVLDDNGEQQAPALFIRAAERYGLMGDVDRWVVSRVFEALGSGRLGHDVAVNLSGLSVQDEHFIDFIEAELLRTGADPARVCFEITETAAISRLNQALAFMQRLKAKGFSFALDDFGAGMSSFAYLKHLPVDYLKIDGAFVRDLLTDPVDRTFVETIHRIATAMGKRTIAEFVESEAIARTLAEIGVNYVQGYGVARPAPLSAVLENLTA